MFDFLKPRPCDHGPYERAVAILETTIANLRAEIGRLETCLIERDGKLSEMHGIGVLDHRQRQAHAQEARLVELELKKRESQLTESWKQFLETNKPAGNGAKAPEKPPDVPPSEQIHAPAAAPPTKGSAQ